MALIPYEPFRQLEHMRRDMDRFFSNDWFPFRTTGHPGFAGPSIDIHETETDVVATCDIPGLGSKEDVDIQIEHNELSISGTINRSNEVKDDSLHRSERFVGRFQRSVTLPYQVKAEGATASYKNGVLEIRMPKARPETRKKIDIQFH